MDFFEVMKSGHVDVMKSGWVISLLACALAIAAATAEKVAETKPNILFVLVDDVGYADLSFNGGAISVPYLDSLANDSIRLKTAYAAPLCTPTRGSILTGRYPHSFGLNGALLSKTPYGLSQNFTTLAQRLREGGYRTYLIGKWHIGHSKWSYTPTGHGFDEHVGCFGFGFGYYDKQLGPGYDLWRNREAFYEELHATRLFVREAERIISDHVEKHQDTPLFMYLAFTAAHSPLQPDPEHVAKCSHITHETRRNFCGLVVGIDEGVKSVTNALQKHSLLDNTIIVFSSDNGGDPFEGGYNYPLRGVKHSAWEGGLRVPAFIRFPNSFGAKGYDYDGVVHVSDWMPTLLSLAKVPQVDTDLDGLDVSQALLTGGPSPRNETVLVLDDHIDQVAIRQGKWKLITGHAGDGRLYKEPTEWMNIEGGNKFMDKAFEMTVKFLYFVLGRNYGLLPVQYIMHERMGFFHWLGVEQSWEGDYLFDLDADPTESQNLADKHPDLVQKMKDRLNQIRKENKTPQMFWLLEDPNNQPQVGKDPNHPNLPFWGPYLDEDVDPLTIPVKDPRAVSSRVFFAFIALGLFLIVARFFLRK